MIKQALILAAGSGKRLDRPGTPKSLVEVGGKPIIFRLIEQFEKVGITKIHIVVGYDKDKIIKMVDAHFITRIELNFIENSDWEKGIAGSVLKGEFIDEPFLLSMGDHIFDHAHISSIVNSKLADGAINLLVDKRISEISNLQSAVKVKLDNKVVTRINRTLESYDAVDMGLFVATPDSIFSLIKKNIEENNSYSLFEAMGVAASLGKLNAVVAESGQWNDVDTPIDVVKAEMRLRKLQRIGKVKVASLKAKRQDFETFDFVAGKPVVTKMLVGRGFVKNPDFLEVIPEGSASSPIFVFTDDTVSELYGNHFAEQLKSSGYDVHLLVMPDGEESKSLSNYVSMTERVLSKGADERSVFISVGGGVVCNVCGFIASTIYRGLDLIHFPTSLMAQCDAAISHKQAINGHRGKNMVGSYFSPRMVAVDIETLLTLNDRQVKDGMAEVVKHALGQDQSYVDMLMNYKGNFIKDLDFLEYVVKRNIELKCALSKDDPKELREAMVLQYGHTVGHPIEHLSGYSLYHGESVAIGMVIAARVARIMGACKPEFVELHIELNKKYGLPVSVPKGINSHDMLDALKHNKRYLTEGTRMALLSDVGTMWNVDGEFVIPVPDQVLVEAFNLSLE
jgi:3-dehydroquinate synthase